MQVSDCTTIVIDTFSIGKGYVMMPEILNDHAQVIIFLKQILEIIARKERQKKLNSV